MLIMNHYVRLVYNVTYHSLLVVHHPTGLIQLLVIWKYRMWKVTSLLLAVRMIIEIRKFLFLFLFVSVYTLNAYKKNCD